MSDEESLNPWDDEYQDYWADMYALRESDPLSYHEELCEKGNGWDHAFRVGWSIDYPNQVNRIEEPACQVLSVFSESNWRKMRETISQSTKLEMIDLTPSDEYSRGYDFSVEFIVALLGGEQTHQLTELKELVLRESRIGITGVAALLPFLKSLSTLHFLQLRGTHIDTEGARLLSEALEHVRIDWLIIRENFIRDEGVECLLSARNSINLVLLSLSNNGLGRRGYEAISHFLRRDDILLEQLFLNCHDVQFIEMVTGSIPNNSKLKTLSLCEFANSDELALTVATGVQSLVCDLTSFHSIWSSNHLLHDFGMCHIVIMNQYPIIKKSFDINARSKYGASIVKRMRSKLRAFYFDEVFEVSPFIDMNAKLMPYVLELVTKQEICVGRETKIICTGVEIDIIGSGIQYEVPGENLNGVYRLLRNCHLPEVFSFPSHALTHREEAKIRQLEAEIISLKQKNVQLMMEKGF